MAAELGEQLLLLSLAQSAAVTEDAVEPISTCNRLEVLDLQSTKIGVKSSSQKLVAGIKTVFPGDRSFLTVGLPASTSPADLLPLPPLHLPSGPLPPHPGHQDLQALPPRRLPHGGAGRKEEDDHTPDLLQIRDLAARCPQIKELHHYDNPEDPSVNFGFLALFSNLSSLTLSGGR